MSIETYLPDNIIEYIQSVSLRETNELIALREETVKHERGMMISSPEVAQFIGLLMKLINAKTVIEVGVFTGYTTIVLANNVPNDGKVYALDVSEEYPAIGQPYWKQAGVDSKIDLRIAPAEESLKSLIDEGVKVDAVFIDANKSAYSVYFDLAYDLVKSGGLIIVDNTLGTTNQHAYNPNDDSNIATHIRAFNQKVKNDTRVEVSMLPVAQGVTLALKI